MDLNSNRIYDLEFIKNIINLYNKIINDILIIDDNDLVAYVFEKKNPT